MDSWPAHCVVGTPGAEFHPELDTDRIEAVFTKGEHAAAYSGFEGHADGIGLAAWLRMRDVTEVDVVGIATDHCVRATALDAATRGLRHHGAARPDRRRGPADHRRRPARTHRGRRHPRRRPLTVTDRRAAPAPRARRLAPARSGVIWTWRRLA